MEQKRESGGREIRRRSGKPRLVRSGRATTGEADEWRWKAIIECSDLAIISGGLDGRIASWNPAAEHVFGYCADEMIGSRVDRLIPVDRRGEFAEMLVRVRSGEAVSGLETRRVRKDGRVINVQINVFPLRDASGRVVGITGLVRDITDRKRLQGALHQSERLFHDVAGQMKEVVWITSADGQKVYYVNTMFERLWKKPRAELYGSPLAWLDSVHPDDRSRAESVRLRGVGGEGGQESIYRVLQPDGEVRWARDRRFPILERGPSRTDRVAVLTEDITLRVNAERAALQLQARLRSLASELVLTEEHERRRLAEALHDSLGQSLSLVRIKLGEMRRAEGAPTAQSGLTEVMSIIDDALESVQTMTFDLCPRGLHDLGFVQATRWLADDLASRFGLEVEVQVQGRERPIEERIRIIVFRSMRELLINVAKHARSRSASISLALSPSSLTVTVSDGGAGFDPDELHSAPRQAESFGLFSVRQHLVELGGDMQIEAAPGEGTRVVLSVPLSATGSSRTLRAPA